MRLLSAMVLTINILLFMLHGPLVSAQDSPQTTAMERVDTKVTVSKLRCEYQSDPLGLETLKPRLSWQIISSHRNISQLAYQIRTASTAEDLAAGRTLLWDSDQVESDQSIHVIYQGPKLASRQRVWWQVRIWDKQGNVSNWSEPARWEMGLLATSDWQAKWVQPGWDEDTGVSNPCPYLRREFDLGRTIASARVYATALGLYRLEINGQKVSDHLFSPGWTSYAERLQYQVYDVTSLLQSGQNVIGAILGDGWYRGGLVWGPRRNNYGEKIALLAQLEIRYTDGSREVITTDKNWKAKTGPILMSDIYNGEIYDARLDMPGWSKAGYDDSAWSAVKVVDHDMGRLVASVGPPVRRIETIQPVKSWVTPAGQRIVDMGQNMVGWLELQVQGPAGTRIKLQHAEVLDQEGNFYTENLRGAAQKYEVILKGDGMEVFEPHFTFHGFRFVSLENWPGEVNLNQIRGVVIHSDIEPTGSFECSEPLINQLQHNIQWGLKGNFLDVPTDCPQRDERLGWTGDAQVFARTACFNNDVAGFYTKWLADLTADQQAGGAVPHVIPNVLSWKQDKDHSASAGWADAATVVPWTVYLCYGDTRILEQQYGSMQAWVDYITRQAGKDRLWTQDATFGDWLAFSTDRSDYPGATTEKDLIRQAYFAHSIDLLVRTAKILGKTHDAQRYSDLLQKVRKVFNNEFVTPNGRLTSDTQTAYVLALDFDLLPVAQRSVAANRLAKNVREFGHLTTGFLGTSSLCHMLSDYHFFDEAFMLLNRREYPSWLYPVTRDATTIWERWDGIRPDGSFQNPGMNSFNHYAYGAIGDWLYRVVAGIEIDPQQPGYKHVILQPHPGGGLTYARARIESMYGPVACGWQRDDDRMVIKIELPPNTTATLLLPDTRIETVTEGEKALMKLKDLIHYEQKDNRVIIQLGSGRYTFGYQPTS